jgi:hypothetical protein
MRGRSVEGGRRGGGERGERGGRGGYMSLRNTARMCARLSSVVSSARRPDVTCKLSESRRLDQE